MIYESCHCEERAKRATTCPPKLQRRWKQSPFVCHPEPFDFGKLLPELVEGSNVDLVKFYPSTSSGNKILVLHNKQKTPGARLGVLLILCCCSDNLIYYEFTDCVCGYDNNDSNNCLSKQFFGFFNLVFFSARCHPKITGVNNINDENNT